MKHSNRLFRKAISSVHMKFRGDAETGDMKTEHCLSTGLGAGVKKRGVNQWRPYEEFCSCQEKGKSIKKTEKGESRGLGLGDQ